MKFVEPKKVTEEIKQLQEIARYKIIQEYNGVFDERQVFCACETLDAAQFICDTLAKGVNNPCFSYTYELVAPYDETCDELIPSLLDCPEFEVKKNE